MSTTSIEGVLEIDNHRGVIYFHSKNGITVLRMEGLPRPIPNVTGTLKDKRMLDISHMRGTDWGERNIDKVIPNPDPRTKEKYVSRKDINLIKELTEALKIAESVLDAPIILDGPKQSALAEVRMALNYAK